MAEPQTRLRRMSSPGDGRLAGPAVGNLNDNWPNNVDRRGEWRVVDRQSHSLEHVKPFRPPTFPGPSYRESRRVPIARAAVILRSSFESVRGRMARLLPVSRTSTSPSAASLTAAGHNGASGKRR